MTIKRRITQYVPAVLIGAAAFLSAPTIGRAADNPGSQPGRQQHGRHQKTPAVGKSVAEQLRELRAKVAKLEAALQKKHAGKAHTSQDGHGRKGHSQGHSGSQSASPHVKSGGHGPGTGHGKKSAGGQGHDKSQMKMMGKTAMGKTMMSGRMMSGMGMMQGGMGMPGMSHPGMAMMGRMKGMGQMAMPSALPGFPGASHLYHIGATGFFLDHPQHITLTLDQKTKLNKIKQDALLKQATIDRRIEDAEQDLWVLTSADKPDAAKIEAKIREIAKLGGDNRVAFIRAVGEAANVLTDEQRKSLVGALPADHKTAIPKSPARATSDKKAK